MLWIEDDSEVNIAAPTFFSGLLSEEQCKARDVRRKARQPKREPRVKTCKADTTKKPQEEEKLPENPLDFMGNTARTLLEKVVTYQDQYDLPSEEDVKKITVSFKFIYFIAYPMYFYL